MNSVVLKLDRLDRCHNLLIRTLENYPRLSELPHNERKKMIDESIAGGLSGAMFLYITLGEDPPDFDGLLETDMDRQEAHLVLDIFTAATIEVPDKETLRSSEFLEQHIEYIANRLAPVSIEGRKEHALSIKARADYFRNRLQDLH